MSWPIGRDEKGYSVGEIGRELQRRIDAGESVMKLGSELMEWVLDIGEQCTTSPNRCLVEIPDTFAVARWRRDAGTAEIARCILGTLKYEPHARDLTALRQALDAIAGREDE
jgi:hypothetical protein